MERRVADRCNRGNVLTSAPKTAKLIEMNGQEATDPRRGDTSMQSSSCPASVEE